jgi:hypothetical protein
MKKVGEIGEIKSSKAPSAKQMIVRERNNFSHGKIGFMALFVRSAQTPDA